MNSVLVTGGLGYIGSHTVVELLNTGFNVVVIDDLSNADVSVVQGIKEASGKDITFIEANVCDRNKLNETVQKYKDSLAGVIHFAAFKAVGESVKYPLKYYKNNILSLINILDILQENKLDNLIFSSSCTVYGQADKLPITEEAPLKQAESPYGNTKKIGEDIISDATVAHDLNAICLRYFNPIGAHPSAAIGESPKGTPQNLVPYITQTAAGVREKLSVFGDDYPTSDGTCVRDYIYVVDLAKAHVIALQRLINKQNKFPREVFNIGTGKGSTVLDVIKTFEKSTKQHLNYEITSRREGDVIAAYADTKKANLELGWKSEYDLAFALNSAWIWEKKCQGIK
jgi:UDP-glucose 4-epimerase